MLQYQQELKRRDCKLSVGGYLLGWPRAAVSDYAASSVTASPFESLYCFVQGAPRRAKGKTSSATRYEVNPSFFVAEREGFVSRWCFGRLIFGRLLFACANHCLRLMIVFENKFSAIISQSQQSVIATTSLRSPLNCDDRSNLL